MSENLSWIFLVIVCYVATIGCFSYRGMLQVTIKYGIEDTIAYQYIASSPWYAQVVYLSAFLLGLPNLRQPLSNIKASYIAIITLMSWLWLGLEIFSLVVLIVNIKDVLLGLVVAIIAAILLAWAILCRMVVDKYREMCKMQRNPSN